MSKAEVTISFNVNSDKKEKFIINFPEGMDVNTENAESIMRDALCLSDYQELKILELKLI